MIVIHEAEDDVPQRLENFPSTTHPYDKWFLEQLTKLHEYDGEETTPDLLFTFDPKQHS